MQNTFRDNSEIFTLVNKVFKGNSAELNVLPFNSYGYFYLNLTTPTQQPPKKPQIIKVL